MLGLRGVPREWPGIAWCSSELGSLPCPGTDAPFHSKLGKAASPVVAHQRGCDQDCGERVSGGGSACVSTGSMVALWTELVFSTSFPGRSKGIKQIHLWRRLAFSGTYR